MKKCPNCGKISFDVNKQCRNCSYVFPAQTPINKLCLAGFICAFIPILIFIRFIITEEPFNWFTLAVGWLGIFSAIVLSIIGMICHREKKIGFGVAGFIIALLQIFPWLFLSAVIWSLSSSNGIDTHAFDHDPYASTTETTSVIQQYIERAKTEETET